jgi:type I restriction enzyme S subunit
LQKEFSRLAEQLNKSLVPIRRMRSDLNQLFSVLLSTAFSGQLTAQWREAHMKELLAEMEVQARQLKLPTPQEAAV